MHEVLHDQLMSLARHVRAPQDNPPPPGIEARRLAVYRQLFFGNLESLLAGAFPVLRASLGAHPWRRLVESFYAGYRCRTPLFTEISGEFVDYLAERGSEALALPPWSMELAHYEWVEAALLLSDRREPAHDPEGDLLDGVPLLSALAWPLAYEWPVSEIGPGYRPEKAPEQPTLLLARRGADLKVHFARLAPLAHGLLESVQGRYCSGRQHLAGLAQAIGVEPDAILSQGLALLETLRAQGVVLGTRAGRAV